MDTQIHLQSGVSAFTGDPFVELSWGDQRGQLTPQEAMEHALAIIECAESAISDAFLFRFARAEVGMPEEHAARMLIAFREYREGKTPPPTIPDAEK